MTRPTCELVIFDLMGTTIVDDGSIEASLRAVLQEAGCSCDEDAVAAVRGLAKRDAIATLLRSRSRSEIDGACAALLRRLRSQWADRPLRAAAGAAEVFGALDARRIRVAITSGLERELMDAAIAAVPTRPRVVVCASDVRRGRPEPDLIRKAMALAGVVTPSTVACVGDTAADLRAAAAAGVRWNIGVLGGAHPEPRLRAEPHTAIIRHLRDLPGVLGLEEERTDGR